MVFSVNAFAARRRWVPSIKIASAFTLWADLDAILDLLLEGTPFSTHRTRTSLVKSAATQRTDS